MCCALPIPAGGLWHLGAAQQRWGSGGLSELPPCPKAPAPLEFPPRHRQIQGKAPHLRAAARETRVGRASPALSAARGCLSKNLPALLSPPSVLLLPKFPLIRARGASFSVGDPQDPWSQPWGGTRAAAADGRGGISSPRFALGWICAAAALWGGRAWFRPHFPAPDGVHRL